MNRSIRSTATATATVRKTAAKPRRKWAGITLTNKQIETLRYARLRVGREDLTSRQMLDLIFENWSASVDRWAAGNDAESGARARVREYAAFTESFIRELQAKGYTIAKA